MTISKGSYLCWNRLRIDPSGQASCLLLVLSLTMIQLLCTHIQDVAASGMFHNVTGTTYIHEGLNSLEVHSSRYQNLDSVSYYTAYSRSTISRLNLKDEKNSDIGSDDNINDTVPDPSSVWRKSMMIPGWGQVVNEQTWKVPLIYGLLAGLTYYSILMDQNYRDYRAAFYNSQPDNEDQRFGPTPEYIDPNTNPESLRYTRNLYRNRRDLTFIGILLGYGLNIVDAYVFAHMRDFDVSDDLSANISIDNPLYSTGRGPINNPVSAFSGIKSVSAVFRFTISLQMP